MPVLCGNDKYYPKQIIKDNDKYYKVIDKVINILLTKKIKSIDIGFDCQYISIKGNIKVVKEKLKPYGSDCLIVTSDEIPIEMHTSYWEDIIIREDGTYEIETSGGCIYIEFEKKIKSYSRNKNNE